MVEREKLIAMVQGLQRGDEDAATELFTTFQSDIYYYIYKIVNDRDLAEDLTQDTFMDILQNIHKLQEPAAFVTWSRQVAYFRCTAHFRKRKELLADEDEDGYSVFDNVEEERAEFIPDAALDQEDFKKTIRDMIDKLPAEQRAALLMRYYEELPVSEIAKIQGVSEGTVKSRLNYGRKAVRQSVEDYEKKSGVKLRSVGILPVLLWILKGAPFARAASAAGKAATAVGSAIAADAAVDAAKEGAKAAAKKGAKAAAKKGAKRLLKSTAAKVVAGVTAATLVTGGGVALLQSDSEPGSALWVGYGSFDGCNDHRYELTVESRDEESISGKLDISYSYDGMFQTKFSGTANAESSDPEADMIAYDLVFDQTYSGSWGFETKECTLQYYKADKTIKLDDYPCEVVMTQPKKVSPLVENAVYTGCGEQISGLASGENQCRFTFDIASLSENAVKGSFTVIYEDPDAGDTLIHESTFAGRGFVRNSEVYFEVQLDTAREVDFWLYGTIWADRLWLCYDKIADTLDVISHAQYRSSYENCYTAEMKREK